MVRPFRFVTILFFITVLSFQNLSAQSTRASLSGIVIDLVSGETLPGVNVIIQSLGRGGTTDIDGKYSISNLRPGTYTVSISYVGYETLSETVELIAGENIRDLQLRVSSTELGLVVINEFASSQRAAINQQIQSNTIVSIVSKDFLEKLPDQNAAEVVGRLPGVSV